MFPPQATIAHKSQTLADVFNPRRNAFQFLRILLAGLVILSHCYPLGGFGRDPLEKITTGRLSLGLLAVSMFFVLSGFLITRSAFTASSVGRFLWHRFLRIFPAYWVCLVICAFVLAPCIFAIEHGSASPVFTSTNDSAQAYVLGNFGLLHFRGFALADLLNISPCSIGHIMAHNPYPRVVNGSLWTLPYEWLCYLAIAGFSAFGILRRRPLVVISLFLTNWFLYSLWWISPLQFGMVFPYRCFGPLVLLSLYFSAGSIAFLYREKIPIRLGLLIGAILLFAGSLSTDAFGIFAPVALPYAFLWLACKLPTRDFDFAGDFSYGLYVYAFPIQQALAFFRVHAFGLGVYFASAILLSTLLGILSYSLVEAPSLRLKSVPAPAFFTNLGIKLGRRELARPIATVASP